MRTTRKERCDSMIRLREIMGDGNRPMTQADFAKSIGVSLDLIKGVESGRNPLSVQLRETIYQTTGAQVASGADKSPTFYGEPFQRAHFDAWRAQAVPQNPARAVVEFDRIISPTMILMMVAAGKPAAGGTVRDRLPALLASWSSWAQGAIESLGLQPQIQALLNELPMEDSKTLPWGMWRRPEARFRNWKSFSRSQRDSIRKMHLAMQRAFGFKGDASTPDSELLTLKTTMRCQFDGPGSFPEAVRKQIEGLRAAGQK